MTSWPAWAAMAGGHNRRGSTGGVGHARRSWNAVRDDYPRPSLTGNAARALPFPKSQRPTCPLSFTPGGTPPAPYGPPRHPPPPGVSRFRRIGSHLRRVTRHPARHYGSGRPGTGSLLRCFCVEQEAARSRCALKTGNQLCETRRFRALITALVRRPSVEHSPSRGTSRCAPGAFSLTAPVFRSPRA